MDFERVRPFGLWTTARSGAGDVSGMKGSSTRGTEAAERCRCDGELADGTVIVEQFSSVDLDCGARGVGEVDWASSISLIGVRFCLDWLAELIATEPDGFTSSNMPSSARAARYTDPEIDDIDIGLAFPLRLPLLDTSLGAAASDRWTTPKVSKLDRPPGNEPNSLVDVVAVVGLDLSVIREFLGATKLVTEGWGLNDHVDISASEKTSDVVDQRMND